MKEAYELYAAVKAYLRASGGFQLPGEKSPETEMLVPVAPVFDNGGAVQVRISLYALENSARIYAYSERAPWPIL